jgi:organic hydroperoxide reductase OsmC/OhrA
MTVSYTTKVIVRGGRAGTASSDDGALNLTLTVPKAFSGLFTGSDTQRDIPRSR